MSQASAPAAGLPIRRLRLQALWGHGRPVVMGILNCTPDSFSDGGLYETHEKALEQALKMRAEGADIIDIGGESTRPGARTVEAKPERDRVVPVIAELRRRDPRCVISVDTSKAEVARAALENGADLVNDVTAAADPDMLGSVVDHEAAIALMHMRGTPQTMQGKTSYDHVVAEVHGALGERALKAAEAGLPPEAVWLDPGIGFGKDLDGNLQLLGAVADLAALGHPVLIGPSRKSWIGQLTGAAVDERLPGTLASLIPTLRLPRVVVRVHDPAPVRQFLTIASRLVESLA